MLKDYLPIFVSVLAVFIAFLFFNKLQTFLKSKTSKMNQGLALTLNIFAMVCFYALIGILIYMAFRILIGMAQGTNEISKWKF